MDGTAFGFKYIPPVVVVDYGIVFTVGIVGYKFVVDDYSEFYIL
jgi:hypothetical protein